MIIYLERDIEHLPLTQNILKKFPQADIVRIRHYKNIFDATVQFPIEESFVLARLRWDHVSTCPPGYDWYDYSFFFKSSLWCVFDCDYCYLKWAFKNHAMKIIFVNYEEIQDSIRKVISSVREKDKTGKIIFYASNYSDIQWLDMITQFNASFIPFFEIFPWVICESRTKSANITSLLPFEAPKNYEIAFSLNPESIIQQYEHKTSSLTERVHAINTLIDRGWKVGLRFLPLLPVHEYESVYRKFLEQLKEEIDFHKVHSFSVGSLLFTKEDYKVIMKKNPWFDMLYSIHQKDSTDGFIRFPLKIRTDFYKLFREFLPKEKTSICLDI